MRQKRSLTYQNISLQLISVCLAASTATADASRAPDFRNGALCGRVVDAASGQPVANATVALQDRRGKVLAWTRTDAQGRYALSADTLKELQLRPSPRRGLLARLVHGVGTVVTAPVKIAGTVVESGVNVIKAADPVQTAKAAAVSVATANPLPAVANVAGGALKAVTEKVEKTARERAAKSVAGERQASPKKKREELVPGEVRLAVIAPGYKAVAGTAGAYWLEPPTEIEKRPVGTRAWLETAKLAPAGGDGKSEIEEVAVLLIEPTLEPSLAPAGAAVTLSVKLQVPADPPLQVRVFAREDRTRKVVELKRQQNDLFAGELMLDPKTPPGETTVTMVALRAAPVEIDLRESKADPLLDFAGRLEDLDPDKPYDFDPRIMASENRLDLTFTVLDPDQATPPDAAAVLTAPAAAPGEKPGTPAEQK